MLALLPRCLFRDARLRKPQRCPSSRKASVLNASVRCCLGCTSPAASSQRQQFRPRQAQLCAQCSASSSGAEAGDSQLSPEQEFQNWRSRPPAITLPRYLRTSEQWILLAGWLKVMFLCATNYTRLAGKTYPVGPLATVVMLLVGAGLAKLAQLMIDAKVTERRWHSIGSFGLCIVALIISHWLFA